jgi:hypothetical protein
MVTFVQCGAETPGGGDVTRTKLTLTNHAFVCSVTKIITRETIYSFVTYSCKM